MAPSFINRNTKVVQLDMPLSSLVFRSARRFAMKCGETERQLKNESQVWCCKVLPDLHRRQGYGLHVMIGDYLWKQEGASFICILRMREERSVCFWTCLESGVIRFKLLVEMLRLILIPANCRLLLPRILERSFEGGWKRATQAHVFIFSLS